MASRTINRARRIRGAAAVSLIATAGILGSYLGSPRVPRAYAQPGAPFEAMFAPNGTADAVGPFLTGWRERLKDRGGEAAFRQAQAQSFPFACDFSVDDSVSLHAAVRSSADGSTICVTDDIPDLSEQLVIDDTSLTIVGAAGDDSLSNVTLTADDTRHLHATFDDTSGSLNLFNLTFENGNAGASGEGGAIFIDGTYASGTGTALRLEDDSFINNQAGLSGGAIYAKDLALLRMRSFVTGRDVSFFGNTSGGNGGAVYLKDVADVNLEGGEMSRNYASGFGGALGVYAGALEADINLEAVIFADDSAGLAGGAIGAVGADKSVFIRDFGYNFANSNNPSDFSGNSAPTGGAIWISESGPNSVASFWAIGSVNFTNNVASADGGAVFIDTDDTGVFPYPIPFLTWPNLLTIGFDYTAYDPGFRLTPTFHGNTAAGDGGAVHVTGAADFGGLSLLPYLYQQVNYFTGADFTGNSAAGSGGAAYVDGSALLWESSFVGNTAGTSGGALAVDDSFAQSGGLRYPGIFAVSSYFADNASTTGSGGAVFVDDSSGIAYVASSTFTRNVADVYGGAVASLDDTAAIVNSTFTDDSAFSGGGIFMNSGELTVNFSTITANSAFTGGGIVARRLSIANSIVNDNRAQSSSDVYAFDTVDDSFSLFSSSISVDDTAGWVPGLGTLFSAGQVVGPLTDNGGFFVGDDSVIPTMLPPLGSPVVDAADPNSSGTAFFFGNFDERGIGFPRIVGGRADMGAVERQESPVPPTPVPASGPREVKAVAGDREVTVTWQAPVSAGSFPVTNYQAVATVVGEEGSAGPSCLVVAPALTCTIAGLTNNVAYTVRVRALTGAGWGASSEPSEPVTPQPSVVKSIVITGSRERIEGRKTVVVQGETTGLIGATVRARVRLQGQPAYANGSTRVVDEAGEFIWQRATGKKTYVYFIAEDGLVRSNRVVVRR